MASDLSDREREELVAILFGRALSGQMEVDWQDVPKLAARLERAGFTVRGDKLKDDFGRGPHVLSVELKIPVKFLGN